MFQYVLYRGYVGVSLISTIDIGSFPTFDFKCHKSNISSMGMYSDEVIETTISRCRDTMQSASLLPNQR